MTTINKIKILFCKNNVRPIEENTLTILMSIYFYLVYKFTNICIYINKFIQTNAKMS